MTDITLKLDPGFKKRARGRYEKYEFEVGVIKDTAHRDARARKPNLKYFAGGSARKVGRTSSQSTAQVSEDLRKRTGINFYTAPFKIKKNADILKFTKEFLKMAGSGRSRKKRIENLLQAIVRNPILRGDYGSNSLVTARIKGFNRFMIDTGQLFKSIIARIKVNRVQK